VAENSVNVPVFRSHALGADMNTINQKEISKSTLISPENMTTGDAQHRLALLHLTKL